MGLKVAILMLGALAILLSISSAVAARSLSEGHFIRPGRILLPPGWTYGQHTLIDPPVVKTGKEVVGSMFIHQYENPVVGGIPDHGGSSVPLPSGQTYGHHSLTYAGIPAPVIYTRRN